MNVTLRHIAKALNLSPQSVSAGLNGGSGSTKVSKETTERVLAYANKVNYRPCLAGKAMRSQSLRMMGVLVESDFGARRHPPLVEMGAIFGLSTYLQERDWNLNVIEDKGDRDHPLPRYLREKALDGAVICSHSPSRDQILRENLQKCGIPGIYLNAPGEYNAVTLDDCYGAELAITHLLQSGHRSILFLGMETVHHSFKDRLSGYSATMESAGLLARAHSLKTSTVQNLRYDERLASFKRLAGEFVARDFPKLKPSAIFCYDDNLAMLLLQAFQASGVRVPHDVSLVGFNDQPFVDILHPALTTVRADFHEMGVLAGEMLLALIAKPEIRIPSKLLKPTLVVRDSSRCLPAKKSPLA